MVKKQDLVDMMMKENNGEVDEEVMAILNKYPDEIDDQGAESLQNELDNLATDTELLARAYDEMEKEFDAQLESIGDDIDRGINTIAQQAHDDLTWAMDQSPK